MDKTASNCYEHKSHNFIAIKKYENFLLFFLFKENILQKEKNVVIEFSHNVVELCCNCLHSSTENPLKLKLRN